MSVLHRRSAEAAHKEIQNLAVIVVWILARHTGQRPPAAMMSLAQAWQVHGR